MDFIYNCMMQPQKYGFKANVGKSIHVHIFYAKVIILSI